MADKAGSMGETVWYGIKYGEKDEKSDKCPPAVMACPSEVEIHFKILSAFYP